MSSHPAARGAPIKFQNTGKVGGTPEMLSYFLAQIIERARVECSIEEFKKERCIRLALTIFVVLVLWHCFEDPQFMLLSPSPGAFGDAYRYSLDGGLMLERANAVFD